jgi:hypothetical protein
MDLNIRIALSPRVAKAYQGAQQKGLYLSINPGCSGQAYELCPVDGSPYSAAPVKPKVVYDAQELNYRLEYQLSKDALYGSTVFYLSAVLYGDQGYRQSFYKPGSTAPHTLAQAQRLVFKAGSELALNLYLDNAAPNKQDFSYDVRDVYCAHAVSANVKAGSSGIGKVTTFYRRRQNGSAYSGYSTTAPHAIGTYKIYAQALAGSRYGASDRIYLGYYHISPKASKGVTRTAGLKKGLELSWGRVLDTQNTSGYQIAYKKQGSSTWKYKTVSGARSKQLVLTHLAEGSKYYLKVRVYRKSYGRTYHSGWSKAKLSVTTLAAVVNPRSTLTLTLNMGYHGCNCPLLTLKGAVRSYVQQSVLTWYVNGRKVSAADFFSTRYAFKSGFFAKHRVTAVMRLKVLNRCSYKVYLNNGSSTKLLDSSLYVTPGAVNKSLSW